MAFSELGLSDKVLQAVEASGYNKPTPIQEQAIPQVLARRDVLGIAQTGTGKTAAFTLPMLTLLETGRARARMPRTLILEPTRELAAQVEESFNRYGVNHRLNVALLIGGVSFSDQDAKITRGVDVLIATPGRLLDHFERGKLLLSGIEVLVIDEADRMLDMGFIPDIERICRMVPFTRQTLFFSATMPPEIQRLVDNFLSNPVKVEVARPSTAATTITQRCVASGAEAHQKRETLRRLIRGATDLKNGIIFCNRKRDIAIVQRSLERHGFDVVALHGDMDQRSRMQALDKFRNGEVKLLIASDVAARGLDIPDVSHVFNYDVPHHAEDYVHRIGRTGRAGRSGTALMIVTSDDDKALDAIHKLTGQEIPWEGPSLAEGGFSSAGDGERRRDRDKRGRRGEDRSRGRGEGRREANGRDERRKEGRDGRSGEQRESRNDNRAPAEHQAHPARQERAEKPEPLRQGTPEVRSARVEGWRPDPRFDASAGNRRHRRSRDDDDTPVGFGDYVPAFMLQAVHIPVSSDAPGESQANQQRGPAAAAPAEPRPKAPARPPVAPAPAAPVTFATLAQSLEAPAPEPAAAPASAEPVAVQDEPVAAPVASESSEPKRKRAPRIRKAEVAESVEADETAPKKKPRKKAAKADSEKAASKKPTSEKAAPKKAASRKAASKASAPEESEAAAEAPAKASAQPAASKRTASKRTASKSTASKSTAAQTADVDQEAAAEAKPARKRAPRSRKAAASSADAGADVAAEPVSE